MYTSSDVTCKSWQNFLLVMSVEIIKHLNIRVRIMVINRSRVRVSVRFRIS